MSVTRKLFFTLAAFIIGMALVFAFVTQIVLKDALHLMVESTRKKEIEELSTIFIKHYRQKGSWDQVEEVEVSPEFWDNNQEASFLLLSREQEQLYTAGHASIMHIKLFGIRSILKHEGETIAFLYFHDPEVDFLSKIRMGIRDSVTILLFIGAFVFILLSLVIAYWLSRRLTAPLRSLLPAIDRLGRGELGIQAPTLSNDEYGTVAKAFNEMSTKIQRMEEVRRNLVADVSHELRTPLTILRGKLELIQQSGRPVKPEELLPIQDELIRLTRLVEDLHQLSLAEVKKLPLEKKMTPVLPLLQRIVERMTPVAQQKGVEIQLHPFTKIEKIRIDPNRITQALLNLLTNALRYTPSGGSIQITVEDEIKGKGGDKQLRITISDTGIGISPEHLPYLFNRFYRTDEARTRNSGGTGLGLALTKEFILAHKGNIEVESQPGIGTTFFITLPVSLEQGSRSPVV